MHNTLRVSSADGLVLSVSGLEDRREDYQDGKSIEMVSLRQEQEVNGLNDLETHTL